MSDTETPPTDWKLLLRYGKLKTPFKHFTAMEEGVVKKKENEFGCLVGPAWMGNRSLPGPRREGT
ncbi:MAG TPA: hypothetical protein VHD32_17540 [Candidatus Didemnitutus sp.]|nr:hypothetical protein [Candidatus Didemnitutus sp.]